MKLDIKKDLVTQTSYSKSRPDPVSLRGFGGGTGNLGKHLDWRDWDETWWEE